MLGRPSQVVFAGEIVPVGAMARRALARVVLCSERESVVGERGGRSIQRVFIPMAVVLVDIGKWLQHSESEL